MVDDDNSAALFLRNVNKRTELPADFVCGIDRGCLPDICGKRIEDNELCFCLPDRFQQPLVREAQIPFLFADEQQPVRIAASRKEAEDDSICLLYTSDAADEL